MTDVIDHETGQQIRKPKPSFDRSVETQWAVDLLTSKLEEPGNEVPYEDISTAIGCDCRTDGKTHLTSAIRIVEREQGWVLVRRRNTSVRRLTDEEIPDHADQRRHKIRRQASRIRRDLRCFQDFEGLAPELKTRTLAAQSLAAMMSAVTTDKRTKQIAGKCREVQKELNLGDMLQALKG